jgi:hypothetical protein
MRYKKMGNKNEDYESLREAIRDLREHIGKVNSKLEKHKHNFKGQAYVKSILEEDWMD